MERSGDVDPFSGLSAAEKRIVSALRGRHRGASVPVIAADTGLDQASVSECVQAIEHAGLAVRGIRPVASFHIPRLVEVWSLSDSAWAALRWMPPRLQPAQRRRSDETTVPVELWPVFWSGQKPSGLRLPRDAERICETMLQAPMPEARIWAMLHLPQRALLTSRHADDPLLRRLAAAPTDL